jgi:hypothetical protein
MREHVDEARRDRLATRIEALAGAAGCVRPDVGDAIAADGDIARERCASGAIEYGSAADQHVIARRRFGLRRRKRLCEPNRRKKSRRESSGRSPSEKIFRTTGLAHRPYPRRFLLGRCHETVITVAEIARRNVETFAICGVTRFTAPHCSIGTAAHRAAVRALQLRATRRMTGRRIPPPDRERGIAGSPWGVIWRLLIARRDSHRVKVRLRLFVLRP